MSKLRVTILLYKDEKCFSFKIHAQVFHLHDIVTVMISVNIFLVNEFTYDIICTIFVDLLVPTNM